MRSPPPLHSEIPRVSLIMRLRVAASLLVGLRKPDFQAAGTYIRTRFSGRHLLVRWWRFLGWALYQLFVAIPDAMQYLTVDRNVSRRPMWLIDENPFANYPWAREPDAELPNETDTVVIGAGFTGAAMAYHWSKRAPADRGMVVLEMEDPASGSSGRNEGLVVMGRYFKMVRDTVRRHLDSSRTELSPAQRAQLAHQFADRYCKAAYRNAERIEQTVRSEGFDCDYEREGWVQAQGVEGLASLKASVKMAIESGYSDWTSITPEEVEEISGMKVRHNAGFSLAAASWHPAKWVWCLLRSATNRSTVKLFTRTKVIRLEDCGEHYMVHTDRGIIRTRHVVNGTEAYTPKLHKQFHDVILPMQEQAACGNEGPKAMKPHVGISASWFFAGRYGSRVLFGSGGSRLPDHEAGRNWPSRFLSKFIAGEMKRVYGPYKLHMTNEWSGTVGYTPDEYPIVGLIDGKRHYIVAGMCGSGSGVSFNAGRCIVNRILAKTDEPEDYPEAYFSPSRLLDPQKHPWPSIEQNGANLG